MLAVPGQAFVGPGGEHDVDGLAEAILAVFEGHAKGLELNRIEAAAGTPIDAAAGQHVEHGDLLGQA